MKNKDYKYFLRFSIGIALFMFLPLIIPFGYQFLMSLIGVSVHGGNSFIFSLYLFSFLTIPIGLLAFLILGIGMWVNKYQKKKYRNEN